MTHTDITYENIAGSTRRQARGEGGGPRGELLGATTYARFCCMYLRVSNMASWSEGQRCCGTLPLFSILFVDG